MSPAFAGLYRKTPIPERCLERCTKRAGTAVWQDNLKSPFARPACSMTGTHFNTKEPRKMYSRNPKTGAFSTKVGLESNKQYPLPKRNKNTKTAKFGTSSLLIFFLFLVFWSHSASPPPHSALAVTFHSYHIRGYLHVRRFWQNGRTRVFVRDFWAFSEYL